jgi:hypothetical protein
LMKIIIAISSYMVRGTASPIYPINLTGQTHQ